MSLASLLNAEMCREFLKDFYLKQPFSQHGGCAAWHDAGNWETVDGILQQADADVLVVRQGQRWEEPRNPTPEEARQLFGDGYTVLVRHAERHNPRLAALADGFAAEFAAAVDVHVYCTPASGFGFSWHYDAEDVFILQTQGAKEYSLRKNTVNPWPLVETLPRDMRYEREIMPLMKCALQAGDWLYIPNGYWHRADAQADSISLAVGVLSTSALDVYDFLRLSLLDSLRWRQRLPPLGTLGEESETEEVCGNICADLADDLQRMLKNPKLIKQFVKAKLNK